MMKISVVNMIPNNWSDEQNQDCEPGISVNPSNPNEIVGTAFTFDNPAGTSAASPAMTGAWAPVYYSTDGGATWSLENILPSGTGAVLPTFDVTVRFSGNSTNLYAGLISASSSSILITRSADPTTQMTTLVTRSGDQPFVEAFYTGTQDKVWVGYNNNTGSGATIDQSMDAATAVPPAGFTALKLDDRNSSDSPKIRAAIHSNGTVYIVFYSSNTDGTWDLVVVKDTNWGNSSPNYNALTDGGDHKRGVRVATSISVAPSGSEDADFGNDRRGWELSIVVDPNNDQRIYVCYSEGTGSADYTLHLSRSADGGATWVQDARTIVKAKNPAIAINVLGDVGFLYQQVVGATGSSNWQTIFERSANDFGSFDSFTLANVPSSVPTPATDMATYLGDYVKLQAFGQVFYGTFCANNTPDTANFPSGVTFQRNVNMTTKKLLGLDGVTTVPVSIDPFFFTAINQQGTFIINRDPLGQDEIDARRTQPRNAPGGLPVADMFRIVVDGFSASDLGLTGPASTLSSLPTASPATGLTIIAAGNFADNGDYGTEVQRFTFFYNLDFPDDTAFLFSTDTQTITLGVTIGGISPSGQFELIKQPDPFILHGDPYWLSIDLRVFVVRAGETKFGVTMGSDASGAPAFIQSLMSGITEAEFDSISTDEETSSVFVYPTDGPLGTGNKVFNFALAKVHYIGLIGATNVRVFFRLFQAQTTSASFDSTTSYRRAPSNPNGQPIALPGIIGTEYVTVPCFASARVDSTTTTLDQQTDDDIAHGNPINVQTFTAIGGPEVDHFFGCWLDINQPKKLDGTPNNVLPITVPATNVNGPFTDPANPPIPVQQVILRNLHQCLIAEIAFDPTVIPPGKDPSDWDKLAQRNLAWSDIPNPGVDGSRTALSTFEIKPTAFNLPANQVPDELMIDWGNIPAGTTATIYMPSVSVDDILAMAARMYTSHHLTRVDAHTLQCSTGGVSYIPVAKGTNINHAGLLSVDLPATVKKGQEFTVVVRQITNAFGKRTTAPPPPPVLQTATGHSFSSTGINRDLIEWRRVSGAFQLSIPVSTKGLLIEKEERQLSVLRWIAEAIPKHNRWFPVFRRYLEKIGGRLKGFGGDPGSILPSPTGDGNQGHHHHPIHPEKHHHEERTGYRGKIAGLLFDHFGDFDGFLLETEFGEHSFYSRQREIKELVERAWRERLRLTVWTLHHQPHKPHSITIHEPPLSFLH